jgi:hypothetical protein
MQNNSRFPKIMAGIIVLVILLLIAVLAFNSQRFTSDEATTTPEGAADSSDYVTSVNITSTTSLESDFDSYLNASSSGPNPADFNDSYSDLNQ